MTIEDEMPTPEQCYQFISSVLDKLSVAPPNGEDALVQVFTVLFAAHLTILDQTPEDERALKGLYRVALLYQTSPPKLHEIMTRVCVHYENRFLENPTDSQACVRIRQALRILYWEDNGAGENWVIKALEIDPNNSDAHLELAYIYEGQDFSKDALDEVETAIRLDENNADAYAWMALEIYPIDKELGSEFFHKCYEKDPTHLQAIMAPKS